MNDFIIGLKAVDWNSLRSLSEIDSMWSSFRSMFMAVVDKHMPIKERRIRSESEKWINDDILSEMRQRDILHRRALKSRGSSDWVLYKAARNRVVAKINDAKRDFVESAISQANTKPKDMWRELKQFFPSNSTSTTSTHIEVNGETVLDSKNMANAFNNFFCGIGHKFAEKFDNSLPEIKQLMPRGSYSFQ